MSQFPAGWQSLHSICVFNRLMHTTQMGRCTMTQHSPLFCICCCRVRCEPSAYKTVCQRDSRSCNYRCVALQPPPCEAGSGFSATSRRCKPCKAGYVSSAGSNVCAACAVDYYSSRDHTTCLPCPPDYSTNGVFGVSRCSKVKTIDG